MVTNPAPTPGLWTRSKAWAREHPRSCRLWITVAASELVIIVLLVLSDAPDLGVM